MIARHIFAAVIAHALDDRRRAAVAHAETLRRAPAEKCFATGCAVKANVADKDIFLRREGGNLGRINRELTAGKSFADVIVGVALELDAHALGEKRTETLAGGTGEFNFHRVVGQIVPTVRLVLMIGRSISTDSPASMARLAKRSNSLSSARSRP